MTVREEYFEEQISGLSIELIHRTSRESHCVSPREARRQRRPARL